MKLVLKFLVISRTGLASELNVDKSLVGRWVAGTVKPSEHNLAKITRFVASRIPDFTLLDWDRDIDDLSAKLGIQKAGNATTGSPTNIHNWIPTSIYDEALRASERRGTAYEGIWKSTRASNDLPGRFVHDICMIKRRDDGMMGFRVGVEGVRYQGWALILQHQIFSVASDVDNGAMMFSIFNGVARQRPEVIDGVNLATLRDAGGSPVASVSVLQRISDLTGDDAGDEALFESTIAELNPLAPEGSISVDLVDHLTQQVTDGPPGIFRLLFGQSMARGTKLNPNQA